RPIARNPQPNVQGDEVSVKHAQTDREASFERVVADSLRTRAEESVTDRCLDAETLAAWADDTIDARERAVVEAHTADCGRCQALLAAMARTQPAAATAPWWRVHMMTWLVPMSAAAAALILWIAVPI